MNFKKIRSDFPIFGEKGVPKELIYLDNAATSQKSQQVIDAVVDFYQNHNANVHRGVHNLSEQATTMYEGARAKVAKFINSSDLSEIVFTKGTTEGINFIADAWARRKLKPGDEILITQAEHHSNFLPWQRLAKELGLILKFITINPSTYTLGCKNEDHYDSEEVSFYSGDTEGKDCCSDPDCDFWESLVTDKTKLVAVVLDSNVLGPIWGDDYSNLHKLIKKAHSVGAKVLVDAAQTIPHKKIDIQKLNPDFLVFSGHKMLAPTGVGVLFIKKSLHDEVEPYQLGGSMVQSASVEKTSWKSSPHKFEAGTPPIAQVIGLGAAVDYLTNNVNFVELEKHEAKMCGALIDGLKSLENITILGNTDLLKKKGHLVTFEVAGIHAHDLAAYLDMRGIVARAGHHCAQPLANLLGADSSLRVSFYLYNTLEDVELFLKSLDEAIKSLKR